MHEPVGECNLYLRVLLIIYKWQFLSRFSILLDKWRQLYWMKIWQVNSSKNSFTLSKSCSFFLQWKAVFLTVELKNLTKKQRKNFLWFWCSFLAKCFSSGWETVCKKLLSLVQVTLTNYTSLHWFWINWHAEIVACILLNRKNIQTTTGDTSKSNNGRAYFDQHLNRLQEQF